MNGLVPWIRAEVECWEAHRACEYDESGQRVVNRKLVQSETVKKKGEKGMIIEKNKGVNVVNNRQGILPITAKEIPKTVKPVLMRTITLQGVNKARV